LPNLRQRDLRLGLKLHRLGNVGLLAALWVCTQLTALICWAMDSTMDAAVEVVERVRDLHTIDLDGDAKRGPRVQPAA
jgi:hypothetical protein